MRGTTRCPYCRTRFKITEAQLEAQSGMVRCGHCMQTFDARPTYVPDEPSTQLELPMLDVESPILDSEAERASPGLPVLEPMTLAEQVAIIDDEEFAEPQRRTWPWAVVALVSVLLLLAQAAYFFRIDIAARVPRLKPALISYCKVLRCTVPLPQKSELMGIESSELVADPVNESQINLNALLHNRAPFAQAFPNLELTLNDSLDKPLARRIFRPSDYLPSSESEAAGMQANHELSLVLHLNVNDLRPTGYRLAVFYP